MSVVTKTNGLRGKRYESYLHALLDYYLPPQARVAESAMDAMCGRVLSDLRALRSYFPIAALVGVDIDVPAVYTVPKGVSVKTLDLLNAGRTMDRYAVVTLFKPPTPMIETRICDAMARILDFVAPGGHLLVVLPSREEGLLYADSLHQLGVTVTVSEANRFHAAIEPEHFWIVVAQGSPVGLP